MAITVYGDSRTQGTHQHAEGVSLDVQDGHLVIVGGTTNPLKKIAVYAPGTWLRAEVTKAEVTK